VLIIATAVGMNAHPTKNASRQPTKVLFPKQ
jgi:hypothetical protein